MVFDQQLKMSKRKREADQEYEKRRQSPLNHVFTRAATSDPQNVCVACGGYPQTYGPCAPGYSSSNIQSIRCCCSETAMQQFIVNCLK